MARPRRRELVDADDRVHFLLSPITIGYELASRKRDYFSVAVEAGYAFPVPWDGIEEGNWMNFPSLANMGFYLRLKPRIKSMFSSHGMSALTSVPSG
jgi:hypothetical protein